MSLKNILSIQSLEQQLNWFKRQIFGEKSEKRDMTDNPFQHTIADALKALPEMPTRPEEAKQAVSCQRGKAKKDVLDKSLADVSFLVALLVSKFVYHLPLYRQHQRLAHNGIRVARSTLTNLVKRSIDLLTPIYHAQLRHLLLSRILAMDETPIKAGRKKKGKMKLAYFWPIYGEQDEICFTFSSSRAMQHFLNQLGDYDGTLVTDGLGA